jgi:glycosyltransferase involved in cell wall biosynthesis
VVLSVFGVEPLRIGGTEVYARELSVQLARHGWRSVVCFVTLPPADVRHFLAVPNLSLELVGYLQGFNPRVMFRMVEVLRRHRPRIVHFHYGGFLSGYPWLARLLGAESVFFTDHTSRAASHVSERAPLPKRWLARLINRPLSRVICVSDYGHRCLVGHGLVAPDRCTRIYNGVDLSRVIESPERAAAFRRRFSIPDGQRIVCQVSWIIPEKGILDLLAAARTVVSQAPSVHFVIVGDGPFRGEYTRATSQLGLDGHVTWTGLVEDPFAAGVFDAADVVCQASRWEEVFGWVIAEAMAYRRPVIATRVGGIPELVSHGESGLLVGRGDVEDLARAVLTLLDNPARRASMGAVARTRVEKHFDLRKTVAQLLEIYGVGWSMSTSRNRPLE